MTGAALTISIVIPAFNEESSITAVVSESLAVLDGIDGDHEVVIVDDASTDGTRAVVERMASVDLRVRLIPLDENIGASRAVLLGMTRARGELRFFIPADFQIHPDQLHPCMEAAREADYVCTRRVRRADSFHRRAMSGLYNLAVRWALGLDVHDIDSGVLIKRTVIDAIAPQITAESDFIPAELIVRAALNGFRVAEVPIEHRPRLAGKPSSIKPLRVIQTMRDLARSVRELRRLQRAKLSTRSGRI